MIQRFLLILILFLATEKTLAQQGTASKQVSTFTIEAPQLGYAKKVWIYLPKNYNATKKKYPVIYMHDAQNLFDAKTSFMGEWNVDEKLDSLNAQVIVVGIEHGNEKRMAELTPYKNIKHGGGNADNYLEFIVKTLKPEIDSKYRTKTNSGNTAIMGSSLGGLTSFYAVLKYPKVFGKAGIFSPSFDYSKDIYTITENTKKIKAKIYFLYGDNEDIDMIPNMDKMEDLIAEKRCDCMHLTRKMIVKDGKHNEKLWRDGFVKAYLWLL